MQPLCPPGQGSLAGQVHPSCWGVRLPACCPGGRAAPPTPPPGLQLSQGTSSTRSNDESAQSTQVVSAAEEHCCVCVCVCVSMCVRVCMCKHLPGQGGGLG